MWCLVVAWVAAARAVRAGPCRWLGRRSGGRSYMFGVALVAALSVPSMSLAAPAPPPNDNYLSSFRIPQVETTGSQPVAFEDAKDTTAATTQTDLFNPDQSGMAFGGAGPESLTCNGSHYGKTIWYDLHPSVPGGVDLVAAGFPTAIALYQWSPQTSLIVRRVGCRVSGSTVNNFVVPFNLQRGKAYTVQIGGLQTAGGVADSGLLDFRMTFYPDHDGDGVFDVLDACPSLPGVQHFRGCPPTLHPMLRYMATSSGSGVRLESLQLGGIPGGTRVEARCQRCGVREVRVTGSHADSLTMTAFAARTLALGDKLAIWVTKRAAGAGDYKYGAIGSYISYTVSSGGLRDRVLRCLLPGSLTPMRTCRLGRRSPAASGHTRRRGTSGAAARADRRGTSS
jgi:hypothetical protein